jgi:mannose-6-phosphate isomerase
MGANPGLLVKLLDAGERLPVHCHPTRDLARRTLGSIFGKTEGWLIMHAEPGSCVWLGMSDGVDRADLRRWISTQDVDAMLAAMLQIPVSAGQVVYVPAGIPHAIGPGVMLTELQEPTSFSILAEHQVFGLEEGPATLALGWDEAVTAFDVSSYADRRGYLFPEGQSIQRTSEGRIHSAFDAHADQFFRAWVVEAQGSVTLPEASFAVLVVTDGSGTLRTDVGSVTARRGQTFVVPWSAGPLTVTGSLSVIACLPPEV